MVRFEWNDEKNRANVQKHGVSFEEAATAFYDDFARIIYDTAHSDEEERFILLGMSLSPRLLIVCHCYRECEDVIRIMSARKADKHESRQYRSFK